MCPVVEIAYATRDAPRETKRAGNPAVPGARINFQPRNGSGRKRMPKKIYYFFISFFSVFFISFFSIFSPVMAFIPVSGGAIVVSGAGGGGGGGGGVAGAVAGGAVVVSVVAF